MINHRTSPVFILPIVTALFAVLTWPAWRWLWSEWWSNASYSHGLLIPLIAGYLVWRRWPNQPLDGDNRGLVLTAIGVGLFLFFISGKATYLASLAMILVLAGTAWTFGGLKLLQRLAFPLSFLVFMVPLPFVERVTLPLALWTGTCSGWLAHALGLDVTVTGASVSLPNAELVIGAQCSGINSIISLLTLTTLLAYALHGPLWGRFALVAAAIPLAMLGNILRVANLLAVAHYMGAEAAFRFYHDFSGPIFFGIALILLIPLARLLQCKTLRFELW